MEINFNAKSFGTTVQNDKNTPRIFRVEKKKRNIVLFTINQVKQNLQRILTFL